MAGEERSWREQEDGEDRGRSRDLGSYWRSKAETHGQSRAGPQGAKWASRRQAHSRDDNSPGSWSVGGLAGDSSDSELRSSKEAMGAGPSRGVGARAVRRGSCSGGASGCPPGLPGSSIMSTMLHRQPPAPVRRAPPAPRAAPTPASAATAPGSSRHLAARRAVSTGQGQPAPPAASL